MSFGYFFKKNFVYKHSLFMRAYKISLQKHLKNSKNTMNFP